MQNKSKINTVLLVIIIILLIIGGSVYLLNKKNSNEQFEAGENNSNIDVQKSLSDNKLFELFDTFTPDGPVVSGIKFIDPEEHLIVLYYWTSQETGTYAVYDYKNNILYKNIGSSDIGQTNEPRAFIGKDKLLMYSSNYESDKSSLTIQDFNNKIIKTLMTDKPLHEVYPRSGNKITIITDPKSTERYILNSETLELSPLVR